MQIPTPSITFSNPALAQIVLQQIESDGLPVNYIVIDCMEHLRSISRNNPNPRGGHSAQRNYKLLLRIQAAQKENEDDGMNTKFGVSMENLNDVLLEAARLGVQLDGVAFHVGGSSRTSDPFVNSLARARHAFDLAKRIFQKDIMQVVNIGGGYPSNDEELMRSISQDINLALSRLFPKYVTVIAEPGKYLVSNSVTLATRILLRKDCFVSSTSENKNVHTKYYLGDGIYGSFKDAIFMNRRYIPSSFVVIQDGTRRVIPNTECSTSSQSSLFGPTCDGIDKITEQLHLPPLHINDWMLFSNLGAYSNVLSSEFNGIATPKIHPLYFDPLGLLTNLSSQPN
eukprot:CAMPEP_0182447674 /NCGR_PEP_ID=MMETSP1172-20130603/18560_1 /TAXON_ID=708627 /ORGANISM="Timspurckia oligopyrenoides, Strain CCMP3278" /LENGTH=340 /DNA_ID=CAMNT_0024644195 /DNA_START=421 /DNA_END=1446 /DNA_ORIENTATION=+